MACAIHGVEVDRTKRRLRFSKQDWIAGFLVRAIHHLDTDRTKEDGDPSSRDGSPSCFRAIHLDTMDRRFPSLVLVRTKTRPRSIFFLRRWIAQPINHADADYNSNVLYDHMMTLNGIRGRHVIISVHVCTCASYQTERRGNEVV
jgi:hypothetical protein